MENPASWSKAAKIINSAASEWQHTPNLQWSSIGVYIERQLKSAGMTIIPLIHEGFNEFDEQKLLDRWRAE